MQLIKTIFFLVFLLLFSGSVFAWDYNISLYDKPIVSTPPQTTPPPLNVGGGGGGGSIPYLGDSNFVDVNALISMNSHPCNDVNSQSCIRDKFGKEININSWRQEGCPTDVILQMVDLGEVACISWKSSYQSAQNSQLQQQVTDLNALTEEGLAKEVSGLKKEVSDSKDATTGLKNTLGNSLQYILYGAAGILAIMLYFHYSYRQRIGKESLNEWFLDWRKAKSDFQETLLDKLKPKKVGLGAVESKSPMAATGLKMDEENPVGRPLWQVKGSPEAKERMARMRANRKPKQ